VAVAPSLISQKGSNHQPLNPAFFHFGPPELPVQIFFSGADSKKIARKEMKLVLIQMCSQVKSAQEFS
jgi:hypothetical protein